MNDIFYGNQVAGQILSRVTGKGGLGHAYLIYGEDGLGKKTFAKLFAKTVLCQGNCPPCGSCVPCRKIEEGIHPDVQFYLGGKTKNSIHIETIRQIRSDCAVKPNESERKIYVLTNVQNMTSGAYNAFLKTLEEPPEHVLFLLTAPNLGELPQTMLSRLIPIQLFPLSEQEMEQALQQRFSDVPILKKQDAIKAAQGNLGLAIRFLSDLDFEKLEQEAKEFCALLALKQEYGILKMLSRYEKDKPGFTELLNQVLLLLRDSMFLKIETPISMDASSESSRKLAVSLTRMQIVRLIEFLEEMKQKLSTNAHSGLLTVYCSSGIQEILHGI